MSTATFPVKPVAGRFPSRREAGRQLARLLSEYTSAPDAVVLGIPQGGTAVAAEIARALALPLDLLAVEEVLPPFYSSWQLRPAIGAVVSTGGAVLDWETIEKLRLPHSEVEAAVAAAESALDRTAPGIRRGRSPDLHGKTVILVDDGAETGLTLQAAIEELRKLQPARIVVSVPAAPDAVCQELEHLPDRFVCLARLPSSAAAYSLYDEATAAVPGAYLG